MLVVKRVWPLLLATFGMTMPVAASAGGVDRNASAVASTLGFQLPANQRTFRVGDSFSAKIVSPAKLGARGLSGLAANQSVRVTVTGPGKFTVTAGQRSLAFTVDEQGVVKRD